VAGLTRKSVRRVPALIGVAISALLPWVAVAPAEAAPVVDWSMSSVQAPPWTVSEGTVSIGNISCLSTADCLASGYDQLANPADDRYPQNAPSSLYHPLLWRWDGKSWTFEKAPISGSAVLVSNSCPVAGSCFAVGGQLVGKLGTQYVGVIEHYNGVSWLSSSFPSPPGAVFNGVACSSSTDCMAVGTRQTSSNTAHVLIDHWDGKSWSDFSAPSPTGSMWSVMDSVTCLSATDCLALGDYDKTAKGSGYFFGERFNGTSWAVFAVANPTEFNMGDDSNLDLSCASSSACLATGSALTYTHGQLGAAFPAGLAESWDGTSWAPVTIPGNRARGPVYTLNGDSCVSSVDCWVAMSPQPPQNPLGFGVALGHWNGTVLSAVTLPFDGSLAAVSCLRSNVGTWCTGLGQKPGTSKAANGQEAAPMFGGRFTVVSPGGPGKAKS
jgi:hypothetical protein